MTSALETSFASVRFKNPVVAASTDLSRTEAGLTSLLKAGGGVVTKSVTDIEALTSRHITRFDIRDMRQNPVRGDVPRDYVFFSRGGNMVPLAHYLPHAERELAAAKEYGAVLIGSISCNDGDSWPKYARELAREGFPMLELNFGNPHGEAAKGKAGFLLGQSPELCRRIVSEVCSAVSIPVVVKLTPQVTDITEIAAVVRDAGAAAVTVMHRLQGLVVDFEKEEPVIGGWAAIGVPWMKPLSLAAVAKVYRSAGLPVCGGNGVDTGRDVLEYIMAGASLVQIGSTLMLRGPHCIPAILDEMRSLMAAKGVTAIGGLTGRVADKIVTYKELAALGTREAAFDAARCAECRDKPCIARCAFGTLSAQGHALSVKPETCTGCSMCQHICPFGAVTLRITG